MSLPNFADPTIAAFFAIFGAIVMLAWWLGGAPEKYGVYTLIGMFAVQSTLYSTVGEPRWDGIDMVALSSDLVGFAGFTAIALNADRRWPLLAAGLQLVSVMAHLTHGFEVMIGQSYADFKAWPTLGAMLSLFFGVLFHRHRVWFHGFDRDWVPFKQYAEYRRLAREAEQF